MKPLFVIPIWGLKISENLGRGDKIQGSILITNDRSVFEDEFRNRGADFSRSLEMGRILQADSFAYYRGGVDAQPTEEIALAMVDHTRGFLNSLWFTRDNNITLDRIMFAAGQGSYFGIIADEFHYRFTSCHEDADDEHWTRGELRSVRKKYMELLKSGYAYSTDGLNLSGEESQMTRAVDWLAMAREQESHLVKIQHYMTCFETIFPTFTEKIAENLAQRISSFLESSERRQEVSQTIRRAYAIRSTIVHGKPLDEKTLQKSHQIVQSLDDHLRLTFNELWNDPTLWKRIN